jgi:hypothetical protein
MCRAGQVYTTMCYAWVTRLCESQAAMSSTPKSSWVRKEYQLPGYRPTVQAIKGCGVFQNVSQPQHCRIFRNRQQSKASSLRMLQEC